jgi:hypothetical protein
MVKLGVNDKCHCGSSKKYKKCCMAIDNQKNSDENDSYLVGQDVSSDKMYTILDHYKSLFPKLCLIDITNNLNKNNYKKYLVKNYSNKTMMFAEKTNLNIEFFSLKSNSDDNDIIIMYSGGYKVINSTKILLYDNDIKQWINY